MQIKPWVARSLRLLGLLGVFSAGWMAKAMLDPAGAAAAPGAGTERTIAATLLPRQRSDAPRSAVPPHAWTEINPVSYGSEADRTKAKIAAMTPEQFAVELAALLRTHQTTPADLQRKVALLEQLDAGRAVTTYFEYKRLYGIGIDSEAGQSIRDILTAAGNRDGSGVVDLLLAERPEGIAEFNSLIHGWALGNKEEAVAWFNSLPQDHPMYEKTLRGLFWGLAESDIDYSISAFNTLDVNTMRPSDLENAGSSLALSMMNTHGVEGMNRWFQKLPEEMHVRAAEWSTINLVSQPLKEVVPWLSGYAGQSDILHQELRQHASRWASTSPEEAINWAGTFATTQADGQLREEMFRATAEAIDRKALTHWIDMNPGHPEIPAATELILSKGSPGK